MLDGRLFTKQLVFADADLIWKAVRAGDASAADFSDALIGQIVLARGGEKTVTFDPAAARLPGFEFLQ